MENIKEIARNVASAVVAYIAKHHDDDANDNLDLYLDLVEGIEAHLNCVLTAQLGTNKFAIRKQWNHEVSGIECGYSYIAHYAINLFAEMVDKRWAPKSRLGQVNTLASKYIKTGKAQDRSTAMKLASKKVKVSTTMHGDTIIEDMQLLIEAIDLKQSDAIKPYYPCLMVNMAGEHRSRPKDLHVKLIAMMVQVLSAATGYK